MTTSRDVIIIGGGLIGLFSAHYLVGAGHRVTVLERSSVGSGAARGNGGWVCPSRAKPMPSPSMLRDGISGWVNPSSPLYIRPAYLPVIASYMIRFAKSSRAAKFRRSWNAMDTLNKNTDGLFDSLVEQGIGTPLNERGFLSVYENLESAQIERAAQAQNARRGIGKAPGEVLDHSDLISLEPSLGEAAQFGFRQCGDRWLDPSLLVDEITKSLAERGVQFITDSAVFSVEQSTSDAVRVTTKNGVLDADFAVLAAGAWSNDLLHQLGFRGMIMPGKGYSFSVRPRTMPLHNIQFGHTKVAGTPIGDRLRIVGTVEFDGSYDSLNRTRLEIMRRAADPFLQDVDWSAAADEWVAPRPMTPDGLPLIGALPGKERIIVATGHNMLGLSLGPSTGVMVADILQNGNANVSRAFDPARFTRSHSARAKSMKVALV